MTDKQAKKEIREVIQKYIGQSRRRERNVYLTIGSISGGATAAAVAADMLLTGGAVTLLTAIFGTVAGTAGLATLLIAPADFIDNRLSKGSFVNNAGQAIKGIGDIRATLKEMESSLRIAFNKASEPEAPQADKKSFLDLAAEIEQDVKKITPAFKIVSVRENGVSAEKYEFIVAELIPAPSKKKLVTLTQALHDLQKSGPQKPKSPDSLDF